MPTGGGAGEVVAGTAAATAAAAALLGADALDRRDPHALASLVAMASLAPLVTQRDFGHVANSGPSSENGPNRHFAWYDHPGSVEPVNRQ